MSTILCPQPSMDSSNVIEATTMRLKLISPKSYNKKTPFEDWNVLQSPSSHKPIDDCFNKDINLYLHNQKSLKLSQKSLEICTESLGSETGSDMSDDDNIFAIQVPSLSTKKIKRDRMVSKKYSPRSFPPPLVSISSKSKLFQVMPKREGGRLVIEAIETDMGSSCLRVERSQGRFKLTSWKNEEDDFDVESSENEIKDSEKLDIEMGGNVDSEKFQRFRRCNEDENGDKGIYSNLEPSCWVAIS